METKEKAGAGATSGGRTAKTPKGPNKEKDGKG